MLNKSTICLKTNFININIPVLENYGKEVVYVYLREEVVYV